MNDLYDDLMMPLYRRLDAAPPTPAVASPAADSQEAQDPVWAVATLHENAKRNLQSELLAYIYAQDHTFFENLIIDLLLAMGYGGRRRDLVKRLGRSHDGGIDGMVKQDELGLDLILLQAKRFKPGTTVSASQVRDFAGGLEAARAAKGIFFTTAQFSAQARAVVQTVTRRIALINGQDLTALMIRHGLGVKPVESFVFKALDKSYFDRPNGN